MAITGTVTVGAAIAPTAETDTYPVTNPKYGLGSLRTVQALTDRNDISSGRREAGMIVYVTDVDKYFKLSEPSNPVENDKWTELVFLPATIDSGGNIHIAGNLIVSGYIETDTGIRGNTDNELEYIAGMDMDGGTY